MTINKLFFVGIVAGLSCSVFADTYWLRGPDSSKGTVRSLDKFANDTTTINGFNASMGWALDNSDTPSLPGTRVTSGSMSGHGFIIHMFDANGRFVEPPDYFPASGVNGEPKVGNGKEESVLQDRWPNRESEGYEKQGYVPKRFVARTPDATGATFPGKYLELRYGIVMHKKSNNVYTINDLRVTGWGVFVAGDSNNTASNSTTRFNGGYTVYPGAKFKLAIDSDNSSNSRNLCVLASGHGSGLLVLGGDNNFTNVAQTLYMNGSLSDFTGPVHLVGHSKTTIQFAYDDSFPADPATPLDDGLIITNGVIAKFTGNATIGPNRKVQLFANAYGFAPTIYVESGKTVRIEGEFSGTCGLKKAGNGTLVFAHPAFEEPITFTGEKTITAEGLASYVAQIAEWNSKHPALSEGTISAEVNLADVSVTVDRVGVGSDSAEVSVIWGASADALVNTNVLDAAAVSGQVCNGTINGLTPSTTYYYAFTATNGLGWGVTTPTSSFETFAANVLTLENATADPQKKSVEVGVTVSLLGAGATSADVYFAYGLSADELGDPVLVKSGVGLNETVTKQITDLTPGTTYYYAFSAENNASPAESVNLTGSFETLPLDPPSITDVTVTGAPRRADITLTLDVGDDVDSAFLMVAYGTDAAALNMTNVIATAATSGQISFTIEGIFNTTQYYCSFIATNELGFVTATGNFPFKATSPTSASRLWVGEGAAQADGSLRWDDHLNWKDGIVPYGSEPVSFPDDSTATIEMPMRAIASGGEFAISNNCNIVLKKSSEADADFEYKFTGKVTLLENSSLTLSGIHVWFANGNASNYKFDGDLTVTEGAYFQLQAGLVISNNLITVEKKSKFGLLNQQTLAGEAELVLDDSELLSEGGNKTVTFKNDARLIFRGRSPQASIVVNGGSDNEFDSHLVFCIPVGGYDRIPLLNLGTSPVPNNNLLYCTMDSASPAYSSPMNKVVPLISTSRSVGYWKGKDTMRLDDLGECPTETMREWVYVTEQLTDEDLATRAYDSRDVWTSAMLKDNIPGDNLVRTLGVYIQGPVSYPVFNLPTIVPDIHTAAVEVTLRTLGVGATSADVYIACGTSVDNLGEYKLVKEGADLSDVIHASIDGLDYDTDYYYALLATNDLDPSQSGATTNRFTTLPAEVMAISGPTAVPGKGISDFSVTVDKLGEGASSVEITLIWGTDKANLDKTNLVTTAATLGTVDYRLYELPRSAIQYYYAFVATNGLGQVVSTITNGFKTVAGSVGCLWSGEGEQQPDGSYRWDDYRNWASGTAPIAGDSVHFPDGTEIMLEMPASAFASGGEFAISNNCNIVLKKAGEVETDLEYKFTGKVTLPATSALTLSGCHVWFASTTLSNYQFDGTLTVTDGAYFQLSAALELSENRIIVEKKSKFGLPQNGITLAGATEIVIDDSEFVSENASRTVLFKDTATLVFKGKSPYAYIFVKGVASNYSPHLRFNIPQGGYDRIPLVASIAAEMPNAAVVYCAIDSQSPAFSQDIDKVVPLIVSSSSVAYSKSSSNMLLDEIAAPAGAEAAWVYRSDVMSDADVTAGTYVSRDAWSDAEPRSGVAAKAVKTLGVYLKCDAGFPMFNEPEVTPDVQAASVNVSLKSVGTDAESAAVYFAHGTDPEALGDYTLVASDAVADAVLTVPLAELAPKTVYYYSFIATNNLEQGGSCTGSFRTLRDPSDTVYVWGGALSGDWDDPESWDDGIVPPTGSVIRVAGTATITRGSETARITDAEFTFNEDESFTLVSGSVMPYPTLDLTQPVAGQPLTVEAGTFGGITGDASFSVQWKRGATMASKSNYQNFSTETTITPTEADYEYFFQYTVKDSDGVQLYQKEFYFSKLPVLYMTTDDGQTPTTKKEEHAGHLFVQGNETWASPYDGAMIIKMRGNTTTGSTYPKKPWKIKLDSKAMMFGIAKSKHWVLLANYKEKSTMRSKLAYDLANEIGSLGMESTWVMCLLNGEYLGLYQFAEHIRVDKDRVDIVDWESVGEEAADAIAATNGFAKADKKALETQMSENFAWVTSGKVTYTNVQYEVTEDFKNLDISGGYLVESSKEMDEVSKFTITSGTLTFESMLNSPEFLNTNPEMFNICSNRVDDYLAALASPDGYNAKGQHWSQLADTDSMATYLLAIELPGNDDAEKKSRFFYWDVGGKIMFGPVWDYEWGVGNTLVDPDINVPDRWRAHNNNERSFYREWTDDPWFCTRLRTLYWSKARDVLARMISEGGEIDQYHDYLSKAAAADEVKWPIKKDAGPARTFEEDVVNLRTFLTARLAWLDEQFADVPTLMESFKASCLSEHSSRPDLEDRPSNSPYTPDAGLEISFPNAPENVIAKGCPLQLSLAVANGTTVDVYVNGLKITAEPQEIVSGQVSFVIPAASLTEKINNDNCVSIVARDANGVITSRNYSLIQTESSGGLLIIVK